jgi:TolB-like protein
MLWADVVESVRLVEQDEGGFVAGWLDFVEHVKSSILPDHHGRLVKGLGDGILMDFESPRSALRAAFALRDATQARNMGRPAGEQTHLRMGIEIGGVILSQDDVYGRSVNRVARLATLVGPDEICLSAAVRDQLTADLDADIEDLGECHVKHLAEPIRAYRVAPPTGVSLVGPTAGDLLPALAVIPFSTRDSSDEHHVLGEVLAEELIRDFSQTTEFNVISRLSTTAFRDRASTLKQIAAMLHAQYVLSGVYRIVGNKVTVEAELVDVATGQIAWSGRHKGSVDSLLSGRREMIDEIATEVSVAVMSREVRRARSQRLSNLQSYTLLIAATALMHRLSPGDFAHARVLLEALIERAPRQALPQALLANWHVLRVQQGWSQDIPEEARMAQRWTRQAIEIDPHCSLALAVDGFVHTNLLKQLDVARDRYDRALDSNPNDALAWLLRGTLHAFMNEGQQAVRCTRRALALSPLDPHRYFYDSLSATAYLAAHQFDRALAAARRSLRTNRTHASTLRAMAVACWNLGDADGARRAAAELLRIEPTLTVTTWLERSPSAAFPIGQEWADTFRAIGLPN